MAFGYMLAAVVGLIFDKILTHKDPNAESPIGMGDIKLISVGGLWCGPTGLAIALVLACGFGATWAYRKKQKFIPFAPFFVIGGFLSLITITFLI
jgi:prepilin signal peptidase PulO-like enzyme (type II secretory pathway)